MEKSFVDFFMSIISYLLKTICVIIILFILSYTIILSCAIYADVHNTIFWGMPEYKGLLTAKNLLHIKIGQHIAYNEIMCDKKYITTNQLYCDNIILYKNSFKRATNPEPYKIYKIAKENIEISYTRTKFIDTLFLPVEYVIWSIKGKNKYNDPLRY
jgi:hypothetical protein